MLRDLDSDHAAAELLVAVAERLAQDVDGAFEVRDRVAAAKALREVLDDLDTGVLPPRGPGLPAPDSRGAADDDDPFGIGTVSPSVGDAPAV